MRTLANVVEDMKECRDKHELEDLLSFGGFIYEFEGHIYFSNGSMSNNWVDQSEDLKKDFGFKNFGDYVRYEGEKCLAMLGMTEDEIENELKSWNIPDDVPDYE